MAGGTTTGGGWRGGDLAVVQGGAARAVAGRVRARVPVAEHSVGRARSTPARRCCRSARRPPRDGAVGGRAAGLRSEGVRGRRGRADAQHRGVRGGGGVHRGERRREARRARREVADRAVQPHQ